MSRSSVRARGIRPASCTVAAAGGGLLRGGLLGCAPACVLASYSPVSASASTTAQTLTAASSAPSPIVALQQPDKKIEVTVGERGGAWYRSPVWIAIGALAFLILVVLIIALSRGGGGTTIVKD